MAIKVSSEFVDDSSKGGQSMSQSDFLIEFIRNLGLKSKLFSRSHLCAPWGLAQGDIDEMLFHYLVEGECYLWVGSPDNEPIHMKSGDFVLLPRGRAHGVASAQDSRLAETDRICYSVVDNHYRLHRGPGQESRFLCGSFSASHENAEVLLRSLPEYVLIHLDDTPQKSWIKSTLLLVEHETYANNPEQEAIITHLLDVLFAQILRWCLDSNDCEMVGLLGAVRDPDLGPTVKAVLRDIRYPWQLPELANISGLSRATFAERFARVVGESPMAFIRMERLRRSQTLLKASVLSVKEVANQVGFSGPEVFIRSFEKAFGCSPSCYRKHARA